MQEEKTKRLTELARLGGCTAKTGGDLLQVLLASLRRPTGESPRENPDVLVGLTTPDDAAVYRIIPDCAIVATVDFFAPIVDDPYAYGAIAAANALSDIYAMGAEPVLALNIAAFPADTDSDVAAQILRGGSDKVAESGASIVGGHTVIDEEPKYGLCVIGTVHPDRFFTKAGARPGDALYITKPIGTGLVTTAGKFDEAASDHMDAAIACMTALNRDAARAVRALGATALTDVTGFGLLGHGYELARAGAVRLQIEASSVPVLPGAMDYAYRGILNGGHFRNRRYVQEEVDISDDVSADLQHILFDPQTSGGLLFTVPEGNAGRVSAAFAEAGARAWRIGDVLEGRGIEVVP